MIISICLIKTTQLHPTPVPAIVIIATKRQMFDRQVQTRFGNGEYRELPMVTDKGVNFDVFYHLSIPCKYVSKQDCVYKGGIC